MTPISWKLFIYQVRSNSVKYSIQFSTQLQNHLILARYAM